MKSLKNHFSVIFPLVVLLFSFQFTRGLEVIVAEYETRIINEYSIIIVSSKALEEADIARSVPSLKNMEEVSPKVILDRLKGDISTQNLSLLQLALPKFYNLKLASFPSNTQLSKIKNDLERIASVSKVETFAKTYDKIYRILTIAKSMAYVFTTLIVIVSLLLMLKQMRIWVLEHKERMDIMTLFGAPFWMKSAVLYRLVIVDSLIATFVVVALFYGIPMLPEVVAIAREVDVVIPTIQPLREGGLLLGISLFFALVSVSMVMVKVKRETP
ncbi:MAG: ABC transporter permease [Campylobacterales bacterium]|nr:ABC transporter permease [Campylobacterales bacterium]